VAVIGAGRAHQLAVGHTLGGGLRGDDLERAPRHPELGLVLDEVHPRLVVVVRLGFDPLVWQPDHLALAQVFVPNDVLHLEGAAGLEGEVLGAAHGIDLVKLSLRLGLLLSKDRL
jgi:hypothetical protein|tara:strand:- start:144 stop:488 length:345 start_codon:yes stop_codon:yes gene_type:complete